MASVEKKTTADLVDVGGREYGREDDGEDDE